MTKNEFKKIAKTAQRIVSNERKTSYSGNTEQSEQVVSYDEMMNALKGCSRWAAEQYGQTILVSGTVASFTVEL